MRDSRAAGLYLCFRYIKGTIRLSSDSGLSMPWPYSVAVQPGLSRTGDPTDRFYRSTAHIY